MSLDRASLDTVPYELKFWQCQCKGCKNDTRIRDYGIGPFYLLHRNSKKALKDPKEYWRNLSDKINLCSKHWDFVQRLEKRFTWREIYFKLCDTCPPTKKIIDLKLKA